MYIIIIIKKGKNLILTRTNHLRIYTLIHSPSLRGRPLHHYQTELLTFGRKEGSFHGKGTFYLLYT